MAVYIRMEFLLLTAPLIKQRIKQICSSPTVRVVSGMTGGNLAGLVIGIAGSLIQARFINPSELGYFSSFSIVTGYAFFFHFGMLDALARFYPYYIGKGEKNRAVSIAEICQTWTATVSVFLSSVFVVLAFASVVGGNWRAMLGWLVQAVALISNIYGGYLSATYRSGHDFISVVKGSLIISIANLFALPLFLICPYVAMAARGSLGSLVNILYLHIHRPLRVCFRFSWREGLELAKKGLPIFIATYGAISFWTAVETSIVLRLLGVQALGFWFMSSAVLQLATKFPQAITAVYTPRIMENYGRTGSLRECMKLFRKPLFLGTSGVLLMAAASGSVLPFLVPILMPKYTGAIPTMCLMMLFPVTIILEFPFMLLIAIGKLTQLNLAVYLGLACFVLLALVATKLGMGLNGVVGASLLGRGIKILVTYFFVYQSGNIEKISFQEALRETQ